MRSWFSNGASGTGDSPGGDWLVVVGDPRKVGYLGPHVLGLFGLRVWVDNIEGTYN